MTQHPGAVNTNIWPSWLVGRSLFMLSNEQGAAVTVFQVTDPRFDGKDYPLRTYWIPSWRGLPRLDTPSRYSRDEVVAGKLWDETEKIIGSYL